MVSFTPGYSWPIPSLADIADGPDAFSDALLAIEATYQADKVLSYTPLWASLGAGQPAAPSAIAGRYMPLNGVCDVWIGMTFGASTSGGTGQLTLSVPLPGRTGLTEQWLDAKLFIPGGGGAGNYLGGCIVGSGLTVLSVWFPTSATDIRVQGWAGEAGGGSGTGVGTGIPRTSGAFTVANGGNLYVNGRYLI